MLALLSWSSGILRTVATMAGGFIATPYVLKYLGAERLGAFRTLQQCTGYLPFLYFGLGPALTVLVLKAASGHDSKQTAAIVKGGLKLELRQTILIIVPAAVALAMFIPRLLAASSPFETEMRVGLFVYVLAALLMPLDVFRILLECLQRGYLVNAALILQALFVMIFSVWLASAGFGIVGQFMALVAGTAVFSLLVWRFSTTLLKRCGEIGAEETPARALWRLRVPMTITGIGGQINLLTDYIVLSMISNPAAVTTFSITQRLVTVLGGFVAMLTNATWAGMAEILAQDRQQLLQERMLELLRLVIGLGVTLLGTLAAYNIHFVRLWVGEQYYGGDLLTILTAVQSLMLAFFLSFTWTIDLQGDSRYRVPVTTAGAGLNLALSFLLGRQLGMYGITLATLIGYTISELWFNPYFFARRYRVSLGQMMRASFRSLGLGLPWAVFVWFVAHARVFSNWHAFAFDVSAVSILGVIYLWVFVLVPSDRAHWRERYGAASRAQRFQLT
jgi:O-antigen/teichoic acid export membrane protein